MPKKKKEEKKIRKKKEKTRKTEETQKGEEMLGISAIPEIPVMEDKPRRRIIATFTGERILAEKCDETNDLYSQSRYGTPLDDGKLQLSFLEACYLKEKGKITIIDHNGKDLSQDAFLKKVKNKEPNFWTRYAVFRDIRTRGYIIKTALKFGADFRVYDRGVKPGEDHARWVVYPVSEGSTMTWYEFAAKNRVAHSTKKRLMIAIVDEESDVTYYEIRWMRP